MKTLSTLFIKLITILLLITNTNCALTGQSYMVIDHRHTDLSQIPDNWIDSVKKNLDVRYYRRSHGSQVDLGGMTALMNYSSEWAEKYKFLYYDESGSLKLTTEYISLDYDSPEIYQKTRQYLDDPANSRTNVVSHAWSYNFYVSDVQAYLDSLENLIRDYGPGGTYMQTGKRSVPVTFVFQTACSHKEPERNVKIFEGNKLIRQHCISNSRVLFDFADIEAYNPDGEYFGDANSDGSYSGDKLLGDDISYNINETTRGNWGLEWIEQNPDSELSKLSADNICTSCAHSNGGDGGDDNSRLHCVLKGQAAWWLFAKLAGWQDDNVSSKIVNSINSKLVIHPNPLRNEVVIEYNITSSGKVKIEIWNYYGQLVEKIVDKNLDTGTYTLPINLNQPAGIYYCVLEINGYKIVRKMININ